MDTAAQRAKETSASTRNESANPLEQFDWMPCQLSLEVAVSHFTVGDLLRLNRGSIVETVSPYAGDVPLRANGLLIGWTEFEVIGNRLAVRITELA
jgi:flagellar motor switch/type III secretory pathway protein FliN